MKNIRVILGCTIPVNNQNVYYDIKMKGLTKEYLGEMEIEKREYEQPFYVDQYNRIIESLKGFREMEYLMEINSFYIVEYFDEDMTQDILWFADILKAFLFFKNGIVAAGLNFLIKSSFAKGIEFMKNICDFKLLDNIFAEFLFGNSIKNKEPKIAEFISMLSEKNPKEIYIPNNGEFFIHPAGLYYENRVFNLDYLKIGSGVIAEWENNNTNDPNAVRLWTEKGIDLGYVPRCIASTLAFHIKRGAKYSGVVAAILPKVYNDDMRLTIKLSGSY